MSNQQLSLRGLLAPGWPSISVLQGLLLYDQVTLDETELCAGSGCPSQCDTSILVKAWHQDGAVQVQPSTLLDSTCLLLLSWLCGCRPRDYVSDLQLNQLPRVADLKIRSLSWTLADIWEQVRC